MAKKSAPQTNVQFVAHIMEFSQHGALAQIFVLDALEKWSKIIAESDASKLDSPMISGAAWKAVATEIQGKIATRYNAKG